MNVIVTGGAGYIGSYVVRDLLAKGHKVIVIDNLSSGDRKNVPEDVVFITCDNHHQIPLGKDYKENNLFLSKTLNEAVSMALICKFPGIEGKIDAVIHLAGSSSVVDGENDPEGYFQNNTNETVRIAKYARGAGVKKFIFASTAAIYDLDNDDKPSNVYGMTKHAAEQMLHAMSKKCDTEFISLRLFNVAGCLPGMPVKKINNAGFIGRISALMAAGLPVQLNGYEDDNGIESRNCYPQRSWIHVSDVARAFVAALEKDDVMALGFNFTKFDICRGCVDDTKRVFDTAVSLLEKKDYPFNFKVAALTDIPYSGSQFAAFAQRTGWEPQVMDIKDIVATELYHYLSMISDKPIPDSLSLRVQTLVKFLEPDTAFRILTNRILGRNAFLQG